MKFVYITVGAVAALGVCYLLATNHWMHGHGDGHHEDTPVGYHKMPDGTLMKNEMESEVNVEVR